MRYSRRWVVAVATAAAILVPAAVSMACVGVASLVVDGSPRVEPGDTVTVTVRSFASDVPVRIHLDSLGGQELMTVPGPESTMNSSISVDLPIPSDISEGPHVLLASQDHHDMNVGQPARAAIYVNAEPPPPPSPAERMEGLVANTGPSAPVLVLIAAAAAAGGLLLAGLRGQIRARNGSA